MGYKMSENFFVKQNHKNNKMAFLILYMILFFITSLIITENKKYAIYGISALILLMIIIICMIRIFESFGIYIIDGEMYYKIIKKKKIDMNKIHAIKIINSEAKVNLAWSSFELKDDKREPQFSMIFLLEENENMKNYPYGDIEFINTYKVNVIMYSIYDEKLLKWIKERNNNIHII